MPNQLVNELIVRRNDLLEACDRATTFYHIPLVRNIGVGKVTYLLGRTQRLRLGFAHGLQQIQLGIHFKTNGEVFYADCGTIPR